MPQFTFKIVGMSCAACASHVQKAAQSVQGVKDARVNLLQNKLYVEAADSFDINALNAAVEKAGYGSVPDGERACQEDLRQNPARAEEIYLKNRLKYSLLFLFPLMYIAMGHMLSLPVPKIFMQNPGVFALTQFLLLVPILFINREIFINGFSMLVRRNPNMNSLIALGSGTAVLSGLWVFYRVLFFMALPGGASRAAEALSGLYFESAGMILTLITLGKFLESRAKRKTSGAVEELLKLAPKKALRVEHNQEIEIDAASIRVGDILAVKAGMSLAADGVVISGRGAVDESALTGESLPVDKEEGDSVRAGTLSRMGYFRFKVTRAGAQTLLSQIISLVENAAASKAPIGRLADRVSGMFVPAVLVVSMVTAAGWLLAGYGWSWALECAVAVLVISCPCALGLATPTAVMVGTGVGARYGILFKSAESLENVRLIDTVVLDKTGTLTLGKPEVTDVLLAEGINSQDFWSYAVWAESPSGHPLAQAVVQAPQARGIAPQPADKFDNLPGAGIRACIKGREILAGNAQLMQNKKISIPPAFSSQGQNWAWQGKTVLFFAFDGVFVGMLALADVLKHSSRLAVDQLAQMGLEVILLSGDNERTARAIGEQLGIEQIIAGVLPQDKEAEISRLQKQGKKVMMVGDGINDAPALARADIGVAVGAGTDAALETADVILIKNDLAALPEALRLSRAVITNIKENLFWAFFYNVCGIPLAAGIFYSWLGWKLNPMFAAACMSLSSVFVVSNALRLKFFKPYLVQEKTDMQKIIEIEGMMCAHCAGRVESALVALAGVKNVKADVSAKQAVVEMEKDISAEELKKVVEQAGYKVIGVK